MCPYQNSFPKPKEVSVDQFHRRCFDNRPTFQREGNEMKSTIAIGALIVSSAAFIYSVYEGGKSRECEFLYHRQEKLDEFSRTISRYKEDHARAHKEFTDSPNNDEKKGNVINGAIRIVRGIKDFVEANSYLFSSKFKEKMIGSIADTARARNELDKEHGKETWDETSSKFISLLKNSFNLALEGSQVHQKKAGDALQSSCAPRHSR